MILARRLASALDRGDPSCFSIAERQEQAEQLLTVLHYVSGFQVMVMISETEAAAAAMVRCEKLC
jgi:hypothetical protein